MLTIALWATLSTASQAAPPPIAWDTGNQFYALCTAGDPLSTLACVTYISGFLKGVEIQTHITRAARPFCIPDGTSRADLKNILIGRMAELPEPRNGPTNVLLYVILRDHFPCPAQMQGAARQ